MVFHKKEDHKQLGLYKKKHFKANTINRTFQKINSFSVNGVLILQLRMHIVSLRENVYSKCLPTPCEHASENLNSLPRSGLIYITHCQQQ